MIDFCTSKIANDGTIPFREGNFHERVGMHYLTSMGFPSDVMKLEVNSSLLKLQFNYYMFVLNFGRFCVTRP